MRPWDFVDSAPVPDDDAVIYLLQRGREFSIHVDGRELMSSRLHGSEDALADLACDRLDGLEDARILVGGLGIGFTLAAALRRIGEEGRVTVSEIMAAVVRWNQDHMGRPAGHPLRDPRVEVHEGDVCDLIDDSGRRWNAILLDVDNGPRSCTRPTNGWLYTRPGIERVKAALEPRGVLGIWSALPDLALTRLLRRSGFETEMLRFTEEGRRTFDGSGTHVLWMARRP